MPNSNMWFELTKFKHIIRWLMILDRLVGINPGARGIEICM